MRNLKKLLAVVVVLAMVAITMVPAFAAESSYTYSSEASTLNQLGLYSGTSTTSFNPDLGAKLTREAGIVLFLGTFGLKADADKMDAADVDSILAKYTDASSISAWAKNSVAYAIKNGISTGTSAATWAPKASMPAKDLAKWIANQLGYKDTVAYATAVEDLQKLDGNTLTADEAAAFDAKTAAIRDDVVGIIYGVLSVKAKDDTKTVVEKVVGTDADKLKVAQDAGLMKVAGDVTATASATGAKKLTVKFNQPIDSTKATFTVTRDQATLSIASTTPSADKTSIDLNMSARLIAGDYTVTVKGLTTTDLSLKIAGVTDETATKIDIPATQLASVIEVNASGVSTGNINQLKVGYKVYNQYGEDITTDPVCPSITWTSSFGTNANSNTNAGTVTIDAPASSYFTMGQTIVLTGVITDSATVVTKTLTVGAQAAVDSVTFDKVYSINGDTFKTDESDFSNFVLLFSAKDQYGNDLKAADCNSNLFVTSTNTTIVGVNTDATKVVSDNQGPNNNQLGIKFTKPASNTDGTATIRMISKTTGKVFTYDVTVAKASQIATVQLTQPSAIVATGETVDIPYTALDQNGAKVTDFNTLNTQANLSPSQVGTDGYFKWTHDYVNNTAFAEFKAPSASGSYTLMAMSSNTGKLAQLTISVKDQAKASVVEGTTSGFVTGVAVNANYSIDYADLVIHDQYDRSFDMTASGIFPTLDSTTHLPTDANFGITGTATAGNYRLFVKMDSPCTDTSVSNYHYEDANKFVQINGPANRLVQDYAGNYGVAIYSKDTDDKIDYVNIKGLAKGTASVDFVLQQYVYEKTDSSNNKIYGWSDVAGSEYTLNVSVIDKASLSSYQVADIGTVFDVHYLNQTTLQADGVTPVWTKSNYTPGITVYGVKSDGTKVTLDSSDYSVAFDNSKVNCVGNDVYADDVNFNQNGVTVDTVDVTAIVTVDANGTAQVITKAFKVSKSAPAAVSIALDTGYDDTKAISVSGNTYEAKYESAGLISIQLPMVADNLDYNTIKNVVKAAINTTDQYGQEIPAAADTADYNPSIVLTNIVDAAGDAANIKNNPNNPVGATHVIDQGGSFNVTVVCNGKALTFKVSIK